MSAKQKHERRVQAIVSHVRDSNHYYHEPPTLTFTDVSRRVSGKDLAVNVAELRRFMDGTYWEVKDHMRQFYGSNPLFRLRLVIACGGNFNA